MKKDKSKNKKPLDTYLAKYQFGSGMAGAGQIFDVASDALMGLTTQAVTGLFETAMGKNPHPKVFDFTSNNNPVMANGGMMEGQPNAEVEGGEVYETPNGQMGEFQGPNHEQGGIDVELPAETKIFSKRLEKAGKSMADRKLAREREVAKIEKALVKNPTDKILKDTLLRVKEKNSIEEQGDMMIQESMNAMHNAKSLGAYMAKYGGTLPKYQYGGPTTDPTKLFGEQITPNVYQDNSYTTFDDIYKNQFGSNTLALQKTLGNYLSVNPNITYDYGGNDGILGNKTKGFFNDITRVRDFQNYLTTATAGSVNNAKQFDKNDLSLPFQNTLQFENQPSMKIETESGTPDPVNFEMYQYLKDNNMTEEQLGSMFNNVKNSNLIDKSGNIIPYSNQVSPDNQSGNNFGLFNKSGNPSKNPSSGYDFTPGDVMGMLGTKVGGVGPMLTTLANRAGDTPNINAFLNYGKQGLQTIESEKGYLGRIKDENLRDVNLQANTALKSARNSARSVNTLRALGELSNAREQETISSVYADYAGKLMGVLGQQAQAENQRDAYVMQGEQARDLADRQDRDNFFTQLNKDLTNYGTSLQKIGKDLNVKEGDKEFLELLPQMSKYGLGMRKGDNGKWEIFHASTGKKATQEEIDEAKKQASSLSQTFDFSTKKIGGKNKKHKVGEYSFEYNFD